MSARTGPDDTGAAREERVARFIAMNDWMPDEPEDAWWASRLPKFRADYLAYAREVIAIVNGDGALTEEQRDDICDLIPRDMVVWDDDEELQHFAHATADWWLDALGHPRRERGGCKSCGRGGTCPADAFREALISSTLRELDKLGLLRPPVASPPADPTGDVS